MKRSISLLTACLLLGFSACKMEPKEGTERVENPATDIAVDSTDVQEEVLREMDIQNGIGAHTQIDSGPWIAFPMTFQEDWGKDKASRSFSGISKRSGYSVTGITWNIIFLNVNTGEQHLLSEKDKIRVFNWERPTAPADSFLFFVIQTDFPEEEQMNKGIVGPKNFFLTDRFGKDLRRITPADEDFRSWSNPYKTNKIILRTLEDSNDDGFYDSKDREKLYQIDLDQPEKIKELFDQKTTTNINQQMNKHWVTEEEE